MSANMSHTKTVRARCLECDGILELSQWRVRQARCDYETDDGNDCGGELVEIEDARDDES